MNEPRRHGVLSATTLLLIVCFSLSASWSIAIAQISIGGILATVIASRLTGGGRPAPIPWTLVAVLAFLLVQAVSIPLGVHPERSLRCFRGSWVLLFPFVFWWALGSMRVRHFAWLALGIGGTLAAVYGIVQHGQGIDWLHGRELLENYGQGGFVAVGNLNSHLTYAGVLLPLSFLALGSAVAAPTLWARLLWAAAAATIGLAILFSFTRSAWVGLGSGLVLFGLLQGRRAALITLATLIVAGLGVAAAEPALGKRLISIFDTSDPRWRLWETAFHIWRDHPITGAGLGSFKTLFASYKVPGEYFSTIHPHNDLLNHAVEAGLLGALAWIGIWVAFFSETSRARGPRAQALRAAMGAMLFAGLSQCYSTDEEVAQLWWMVAVLAIYESGGVPRHPPLRRASQRFKAITLPLIAGMLAGRQRADTTILTDPADRTAGARSLPTPQRILVVRQDNRLGNLLLMSPFLQRLRSAFPEATIGMVTGEAYAPLLRAWPWVDEWFVQPKREHAQRPWRFPGWLQALRDRHWDVAFEMSNYNTHSYFNCVLTLASGAPIRIGFAEPRSRSALTHHIPHPPPDAPFAWAPLALLAPFGLPGEPPFPPLRCPMGAPPSPAFLRWSAGITAPYAVVHVGGRGDKAWPVEAWARLLPQLPSHFSGTLVLVAGPGEWDRLPHDSWGPRVQRAPAFPIADLAYLLAGSGGYLGCDSGPMHLAAALGVPVVALFFRSNPHHYAPLGPEHTVVLLADPSEVDDAAWNEEAERARILRAERSALESRQGSPRADDFAVSRILEAVDSTWKLALANRPPLEFAAAPLSDPKEPS